MIKYAKNNYYLIMSSENVPDSYFLEPKHPFKVSFEMKAVLYGISFT